MFAYVRGLLRRQVPSVRARLQAFMVGYRPFLGSSALLTDKARVGQGTVPDLQPQGYRLLCRRGPPEFLVVFQFSYSRIYDGAPQPCTG